MLLYFPSLLPESLGDEARQALPEGVRFLDPGLARPGSPDHVLPEAAPFDRRHARSLLADTLNFGLTMASPRDLAVQGLLQEDEALSREGSLAVLAEVERCLTGEAGALDADPALQARRQAQMLLLLAWSLEERVAELRGIGQGLSASWERLGRSVSKGEAEVDDDPEDGTDHEALAVGRMLSGMGLPDVLPEPAPWRKVLEAMAALAPQAVLCTADADIAGQLAEAGLRPDAAGVRLEGLAEPLPCLRAPAWRFLGLPAAPESKPWLGGELTLALAGPAAQAFKGA